MLDAHTDSVDENSDHYAPAEVLALYNAPQFPPHIIPDVFTMSKACPLSLLLSFSLLLEVVLVLARLFHCILLVFLPAGRVSRRPRPLFHRQCTYGAVLGVLRDGQTDGVSQRLRAVVLLVLVRTLGC